MVISEHSAYRIEKSIVSNNTRLSTCVAHTWNWETHLYMRLKSWIRDIRGGHYLLAIGDQVSVSTSYFSQELRQSEECLPPITYKTLSKTHTPASARGEFILATYVHQFSSGLYRSTIESLTKINWKLPIRFGFSFQSPKQGGGGNICIYLPALWITNNMKTTNDIYLTIDDTSTKRGSMRWHGQNISPAIRYRIVDFSGTQRLSVRKKILFVIAHMFVLFWNFNTYNGDHRRHRWRRCVHWAQPHLYNWIGKMIESRLDFSEICFLWR